MPRHLHLDWETFSEADIRDVGAYRYAFDPSTEILCAAMAFDDKEPVVWHAGLDEIELMEIEPYWAALQDPTVLIYAHNAMFESAICQALLQKTWGIPAPALERFRCTMSLARRASLPGKLEKLAEVLKLGNQKDTRGKSLLKKFSMMQAAKKPTKKNPDGLPPRRILPTDEPEAFAELLAYCAQDVRAEQEVARKLAYFDEPINNRNYTLDQRINARGVPVNLSALRHAQKLIDEETEIVSAKFRELTGFEVTQNAVLLKWVNENGYNFDNLQAETVDSFVEQHERAIRFYIHPESDSCYTAPSDQEQHFDGCLEEVDEAEFLAFEKETGRRRWAVVVALRLKQSIAYASIKKVKTMLECAGPHDNKIRGTKTHHGCTTGRWSDSLVQFANMKRSTIKHSESAYADICDGMDREMFEICNGSVLEVLSSSIRHFCQDYPRNIFDTDYTGIEARIVCWLAGQEDALERFRAYDRAKGDDKKALDPYRVMAGEVYRIPVREVQPFPHRFVGKGLVLGAGFMLSPAGFRRQCLDQAKYDLPEGEEHHAIGTWRKKHNKVVKWWYALDDAGKNAVLHEGRVYPAGKVSFCCKQIEGMRFLLMRLPSGRKLAYPRPRIVPGKFEGTTQIEYWGNIKGAMWGWCRLWPGVMANNSTQATANDVMYAGAHNCEREGYQIFNVVHDQALSYIQPEQTSERFAELLTTMPDWADGIPLASEGGEAPFYRKS